MSIQDFQLFTKEDWLDRMYRKSDSESTKGVAETALHIFSSFCTYQNKTETELINEYQVSVKTGDVRKVCLSLDRLVQFMNTEHPEIKYSDPFFPERKIGFKKEKPKIN